MDETGNLPPGIHDATIEEVKTHFATNRIRKRLFSGLLEVLAILSGCNCPEVFLDGSFVTKEENPDDYDLCYEPAGIKPTSAFYEFLKARHQRRERYFGDIFPRMPQPPYEIDHVEYWQGDTRQDDLVKGILRIVLRPESNAQE